MLPVQKKRGMIRMTRVPAIGIVSGAVLVCVLLFLGWQAINNKLRHKEEEDWALPATSDLTKHAPESQPKTLEPKAQPAPSPAVIPPPVDPMEEVRKRAWALYYREWEEHQEKAHKAAFDAYTASPTGTPTAEGGGIAGQPQLDPNGQMVMPGGGHGGGTDRDRQLAFLNGNKSDPSTDYLSNSQGLAQPTAPLCRWEVKAGTTVTGTLTSKMNSDTPGMMIARVARTVPDDQTGTEPLIPQGSDLLGTYDSTISYGQTRLVAGFTRIIFPAPGRESLDIGMMGGSDQEGAAGFSDLTNNHLGKIFLNASLLALFSAATQLAQPQPVNGFGGSTYSSGQIAAGAAAQQLTALGMEFARRGLDIQPTEEIRKGYPFTILVTHDICFPHPWRPGHPVAEQVNYVQ